MGELKIALSSIETLPGRRSIAGLREITVRMYETQKYGGGSAEVSDARNNWTNDTYHDQDGNWAGEDYGEWDYEWIPELDNECAEVTWRDGSVYLTKPKNPSRRRNLPGIHEASRRGAEWDFSHTPNLKGEAAGSCAFGAAARLADGWNAPFHSRKIGFAFPHKGEDEWGELRGRRSSEI